MDHDIPDTSSASKVAPALADTSPRALLDRVTSRAHYAMINAELTCSYRHGKDLLVRTDDLVARAAAKRRRSVFAGRVSDSTGIRPEQISTMDRLRISRVEC
jgi:hypothetical protein